MTFARCLPRRASPPRSRCLVDHVGVRERDSGRVDDDARAETALRDPLGHLAENRRRTPRRKNSERLRPAPAPLEFHVYRPVRPTHVPPWGGIEPEAPERTDPVPAPPAGGRRSSLGTPKTRPDTCYEGDPAAPKNSRLAEIISPPSYLQASPPEPLPLQSLGPLSSCRRDRLLLRRQNSDSVMDTLEIAAPPRRSPGRSPRLYSRSPPTRWP